MLMNQDLIANTTLSHYRIARKLGAGGMGEVYLAEDTRLDRRVALKILPEAFASDAERMRRFVGEAKAASALNHPNILTVHDIGVIDGTHYIATEYIEGETLRRHIQHSQMKLREVLDIIVQVASALAAAHQAGIIHRDLKPENVMLRPDGIVKVLDFGLAKLTEKTSLPTDSEAATLSKKETDPGTVMGTVQYMSPEQARGRSVDARTDIFSLGIVLYEMVAGRVPFAGESSIEVVAAILEKEPLPLARFTDEVPPELQRIVTKSLRKECDERYQTMKDVLLDLKELRDELALEAKLERSVRPASNTENQPMLIADGEITREATQQTKAATAQTTSSAEYLVSEIKNHKQGVAVSLGVVLLAAIGLGYWLFFLRAASVKQIESIAVLPFVNESGNQEVEYLSDGMTETLISSLSNLPNLNVKPRSSVFRYKGKETNPRTIGNELNVQAILNGRVVQRGQEVSLFVELIDVALDKVVWSEQYHRRQADLVTLQSEIAKDVSSKLKTRLSGVDEAKVTKNYTASPEAYQLYLKGRFYWGKRTARDLHRAVEHFQNAITIDPNYALAFAGLADAYALLAAFGGAAPRETLPKAKEAALRAIVLDAQLAEPHVALGQMAQHYEYDFAEAERRFKRAIELNPNYAFAHEFYGTLLSTLGRHQEAEAEFRRALELEPLSLGVNRMYGEMLLFARRYDESIVQLKKTIELDDSFASAHRSLGRAYLQTKNYAGHVEEFARHYDVIGEPRIAQSMRESFRAGGWQGYLRSMTEGNRPAAYYFPFYAAIYYAQLGDREKACAELEKTYEERLYYIAWMKTDPCLDPLRDAACFQELLKKIGISQ